MESVVTEERYRQALGAVTRNEGAAGIDRMSTAELETHLLKGTYVTESCEAGRNTKAERRNEATRNSNGARPVYPTTAAAGVDTGI